MVSFVLQIRLLTCLLLIDRSIILLSPSMSILSSFGDKMPPCRTPLVTLNTFEMEQSHLTNINVLIQLT